MPGLWGQHRSFFCGKGCCFSSYLPPSPVLPQGYSISLPLFPLQKPVFTGKTVELLKKKDACFFLSFSLPHSLSSALTCTLVSLFSHYASVILSPCPSQASCVYSLGFHVSLLSSCSFHSFVEEVFCPLLPGGRHPDIFSDVGNMFSDQYLNTMFSVFWQEAL